MLRSKPELIVVGSFNTEIQGQTIAFTLKKSKIARHIRLEVRPHSGLSVIVPHSSTLTAALDVIQDKKRWITAKLHQFEQARNAMGSDQDSVWYLGEKLTIEREITPGHKPEINRQDNRLLLRLPQDGEGRELVELWLKRMARPLFEQLIATNSAKMGVDCRRLRISSARNRWGSCSTNGFLSLNWKLVMAKPEAIEYVVIHELCHIKELNHSAAFWKLVETFCPDWKTRRKWLKSHEALLTHEKERV